LSAKGNIIGISNVKEDKEGTIRKSQEVHKVMRAALTREDRRRADSWSWKKFTYLSGQESGGGDLEEGF